MILPLLLLLSPLPFALSVLPALHWAAPFFSGGGYCSEATSIVAGLSSSLPALQLSISQHGDTPSPSYLAGLPPAASSLLRALQPPPAPPSSLFATRSPALGTFHHPTPLATPLAPSPVQ